MRFSLNIWKGRRQVKIAYLKMVRENKLGGILASIQVHDNVKNIIFTKLYFTLRVLHEYQTWPLNTIRRTEIKVPLKERSNIMRTFAIGALHKSVQSK